MLAIEVGGRSVVGDDGAGGDCDGEMVVEVLVMADDDRSTLFSASWTLGGRRVRVPQQWII